MPAAPSAAATGRPRPPRGPLAPPERLDVGVSAAEAERALRDLRRVYRVLGASDLQRALLRALHAGRGDAVALALDLGCGGGHVGDDLRARARRHGRSVRVVGVDLKLAHLLAGRRLGSSQLPVVADAAALPFADGAFAIAFSHLFFHHFDGEQNRDVLAAMRRVARRVIVVDLRPGWLARLGVRPLLRLLGLSPVAYEDGILSVERAYSLDEVRALTAGMPVERLRRTFPERWLLDLRGEL